MSERNLGYALKVRETGTWLLTGGPAMAQVCVAVLPSRSDADVYARRFNASSVARDLGISVVVEAFDGWQRGHEPQNIKDIGSMTSKDEER